jgi:heat shock protein HslJ
VTEKACAPSLMNQETRVLAILRGVQRFSFAADGALLLHAADGRTLLARR